MNVTQVQGMLMRLQLNCFLTRHLIGTILAKTVTKLLNSLLGNPDVCFVNKLGGGISLMKNISEKHIIACTCLSVKLRYLSLC